MVLCNAVHREWHLQSDILIYMFFKQVPAFIHIILINVWMGVRTRLKNVRRLCLKMSGNENPVLPLLYFMTKMHPVFIIIIINWLIIIIIVLYFPWSILQLRSNDMKFILFLCQAWFFQTQHQTCHIWGIIKIRWSLLFQGRKASLSQRPQERLSLRLISRCWDMSSSWSSRWWKIRTLGLVSFCMQCESFPAREHEITLNLGSLTPLILNGRLI